MVLGAGLVQSPQARPQHHQDGSGEAIQHARGEEDGLRLLQRHLEHKEDGADDKQAQPVPDGPAHAEADGLTRRRAPRHERADRGHVIRLEGVHRAEAKGRGQNEHCSQHKDLQNLRAQITLPATARQVLAGSCWGQPEPKGAMKRALFIGYSFQGCERAHLQAIGVVARRGPLYNLSAPPLSRPRPIALVAKPRSRRQPRCDFMLFPRASILAAQRAPGPLFRLAVVLLALVQLVAPSWHVCELGGYSCHTGHGRHAKAEVWKPKCGGGPVCPCVKPPGAIVSLTGQVLDGRDTPQHGTCLALLLMSMPGAIAPAVAVALLLARRGTHALPPLLPFLCALLRQPPARGPPHLSFA